MTADQGVKTEWPEPVLKDALVQGIFQAENQFEMLGEYRAVDDLFDLICKTTVKAVERYVEVSGEAPYDMPELFLASFVFDHLGSTRAMTLETNIGKLLRWGHEQKARTAARPEEAVVEVILEGVLQSLTKRPRIDLVVFDGKGRPSQQSFAALIEFKRHKLDVGDREKLLAVLDQLGVCPWGAICSIVDAPLESEWLQSEKLQADISRDRWFAQNIPNLPFGIETQFSVCLRAFGRTMPPKSLALAPRSSAVS